MTDRVKGFTVILDKEYREDDMENLENAIRQFNGVISVKPIKFDSNDLIIREQVKRELIKKLYEVLL